METALEEDRPRARFRARGATRRIVFKISQSIVRKSLDKDNPN